MITNFTFNRQVLELAKNDDHFMLVYPNTRTGRTAARRAVRDWLVDGELDFDRCDAGIFWKAIDVSRLYATSDRFSERDGRWGWRRLGPTEN